MSETASVLDERKEALEARASGLGGTDISAVVGMNPWKNALDVYLGKLGLSGDKDITEPMFWGTAQESLIRDAYSRRTGWAVVGAYPKGKVIGSLDGNQTLAHPEVPCVIGTPDGFVPTAERGLEIKTSAYKGEGWGKPGSDEVPVHYTLQCAQYMAITGLEVWDLACLFSGNRLEIFTLHRNPEIEEQILAAAKWFWTEHILKKVPPPIDGSQTCSRYLAKKYALGSQTYIEAAPEIVEVAKDLRQTQAILKQADEAERRQKNMLAEFIGENKGCYFPDGSRAQWIRPKPTAVTDWEKMSCELYTFGRPNTIKGELTLDEVIAEFTDDVPNTPYIRLYEPSANQRRLKQ